MTADKSITPLTEAEKAAADIIKHATKHGSNHTAYIEQRIQTAVDNEVRRENQRVVGKLRKYRQLESETQ